jgi:KaiC/GvpD/RAD55 family RecA-like ATPase
MAEDDPILLAMEKALADAQGGPAAGMPAVPFTMIPGVPVVPLWPGWIARRHVTLVVAPGGTGKGLLAVDVGARTTTGRPWPGEPEDATREPEGVVIVAPEDDPNEALAYRLAAARADPALVWNLTELPDRSPFQLPGSLPEMRGTLKFIRNQGVRPGLVILDPMMAMVDRPVSTNIGARRVLAPLQQFARDEDVAVLLTHHTVKSGQAAGSKAITDACRHVLRIGRANELVRVITVEKSNMGTDSATLRYAVIEDGENTRIDWDATGPGPERRSYVIAAPPAVAATESGPESASARKAAAIAVARSIAAGTDVTVAEEAPPVMPAPDVILSNTGKESS